MESMDASVMTLEHNDKYSNVLHDLLMRFDRRVILQID